MSMPVSRLSTLLILSFAASSAAAQTLLATHGETVLAAGDPAPGVIGATMINTSAAIDSPVMDQNGALLFRGRMLGAVTGADDRAYFYGHSNGNLRLVARASDQAPGCLPGTLLRSSSPTAGSVGLQTPPKISPFGEFVLFRSKLYDPVTPANTPTTSDTGVFYGTVSGGLLLLAREGEQMPSLPAGVLWGEMDNGNLPTGQMYHVNAGGAVLFQTPLAGAVTTGDDAVMVTGSPGSLQIVSREGDVLPDGSIVSVQATTPTGSVTLGFTSQLNASGQVLHDMRFSITSGSATATNDRALALWSGGTNVIIAREGDAAPGTVGASFLDGTGWSPVASMLTRSGNTTLAAALSGGDVAGTTNNRALYFGGLAGWVMVMRKGDLAPGLAGGELFNVVNDSSIACNDSGQVAFLTSFVQAGSVTAANDTALWLGTAGNLTMMAREGDACVAAGLGGGPWTYADIGTGGTATPRLNDRGEMLWQPSITDGTSTLLPLLSWTPTLGWVCVSNRAETLTTTLGGPALITSLNSQGSNPSGDGGVLFFNNQGDWAYSCTVAAPVFGALVRGHAGSLIQKPASIAVTPGGSQNFVIDCGAPRAFNIYALVGSQSGTRPGTPSPLGPQTIPLNFDAWTQLSLSLANSVVYTNSLGFLDANGRGAASLNMPAGLGALANQTLHHAVVALDINLASTFVTEPAFVRFY
jgi:hypothetical protein